VGSLVNDDGGSIVFYDLQPTHAEDLKNRVGSSLSVAEYMSAPRTDANGLAYRGFPPRKICI